MCWYKNDHKITDGGNYKVMFVDSTAYLQLHTTRFEDSGVYTCEAHNDAGSVSCSTVLTVQGQKPNKNLSYNIMDSFFSVIVQHEQEGMPNPWGSFLEITSRVCPWNVSMESNNATLISIINFFLCWIA